MDGVSVGFYGLGQKQAGADVTIATLQTLSRMSWYELYEWSQEYGLCIVDECHHIPATTFLRTISAIPARYRLGLTATPERHDRLTEFMVWSLGPVLVSFTVEEMEERGNTLPPSIYRLDTGWTPSDDDLRPYLRRRELADDPVRNDQILTLVRESLASGRVVLVLVDLVQHAKDLSEQIDGSHVLVGEVSPKRRAEVLAAMSRDGGAVFATTVADEGLDLPRLDTVVLATPTGNTARIEQRIGRALRPVASNPDKRPIVFDLVDAWGPYRGAWRKRRRLYDSHRWEIVRSGQPFRSIL